MGLANDLLSLRNAHGSAAEKDSLDNQCASSLKEHDYIGLAEVSSAASAELPECQSDLNLAETELHLGLGLGLGLGPLKKTFPAEDTDRTLTLMLAQKEALSKPAVEAQKCPGVQALLKPRQCAVATRDMSTDNHHSGTLSSARDFQSSKGSTSVQDYGEGTSRACTTFYGGNSTALKNGTKRAYTEAMNEAAKFSGAAVVVGDVKFLPKHQQAAFLPNWKPGVAAAWQAGVEQSAALSFSSSKAGPTLAAQRAEKPVVDRGGPLYKAQDMSGAAKESVANEEPPPPKGQVVGWPPVRSYRKNMVKPPEMFVKVNMDGVTVGRKVDLNAHHCYESLLSALEDMFQPSNNAQGGSHASSSREDAKQFKFLNGSDFVLTYEDQDGDWMMVGDVPWSMFVNMVRRLRITRGSEAIGLAPTRPEKVI